jgi:NADPH:quinone reductase-like Zn-dependent oxidoreductase
MKAAINETYGPPTIISIQEVNKPEIRPSDVLVKIFYSSVNRTDAGFLRGKPFATRFFTGLIKPKYITVGCEFSGIIEEVGNEVKNFKAGDKVFGFDDQNFGCYAEYKAIDENKMIEKIPSNISLEQAAVSLEGAHYALFYIYQIPKNSKIFVNGATVSIGSAAVQLLKARGFYVEASSTTKQKETVKKLGADKVIDWEKQDITDDASKCDVYFDSVGKSRFKEACKILNPGGLYMSSELGYKGENPLMSLINPIQKIFTKRNIKFPIPKTRKKEASIIKKHLENGTFIPLLDKQYLMKEIPKAFEYVESCKKVGNVLIKIK